MKARLVHAALIALALLGAARAEDEWKLTGTSTRVKSVAFVSVKVYAIESWVKELPKTKSKRAMIELECGKKLVWTMRRDVEAEKIRKALVEAFELNGYKDAAAIETFTGPFRNELKENSHVTIVWDPARKETTVEVDGGGKAAVPGAEFMRAAWSLWFGKIDQEELGEELISKLPG